MKKKLAATDWLIDQVVYRVYGLTEEEFAVVGEDGERIGSLFLNAWNTLGERVEVLPLRRSETPNTIRRMPRMTKVQIDGR